MRPCQASYHTKCLAVGYPFVSRRQNGAGLCFPKVTEWATFICELCTVRAVLQRELHGARDIHLLCLERMRLLDMAHYWSKGTHVAYQPKLRVMRGFGDFYGIPGMLRTTKLKRPPVTDDIPLLWCQEAYSLREPGRRRARMNELFISYDAVRQLRSAASQFYAWDLLVSKPSAAFMNRERRVIALPCRSTDSLSYSLHAHGMKTRIGTQSHPSIPLRDRHIRALDAELNLAYLQARSPRARRRVARAGLANLILWLAWLRSSETFGLRWCDVFCLPPELGGQLDLPPNCGLLSLRLLPKTKSSRTVAADVILAYKTLSGLHPGKWYERLLALHPSPGSVATDTSPIFSHEDGTPWTSLYFRHTWLYPSLRRQRTRGDALLLAFDNRPGNTLEDKFYSLHCYRRGARSHVSKGERLLLRYVTHRFRRATNDQVYMHGRWKRRRTSEAIDKMNQEWTPRDRVRITLFSH